MVDLSGFTPVAPSVFYASMTLQIIKRRGDATKLLMRCESQSVRYTTDGTNPTASVGNLLAAADGHLIISLEGVQEVRVIQAAGGATLNVQQGK